MCCGPDGILVIDGNFLERGPELEAAMEDVYFGWRERTLGVPRPAPGTEPLPFRFLVNTHWHVDHTATNPYFGVLGARVVAHETVLPRLRGDKGLHPNRVQPPMHAEGLPSILVRDALTLHLNGEEVRILHFPGAHTDGDLVVWLPASKVAFLGDVYWSKSFPYMELKSGGRPQGILRALQRMFELFPHDTVVVPGHGPATGLARMQAFHDMMADCDRQVRELVTQRVSITVAYSKDLFGEYEPEWAEHKRGNSRDFIQLMWFVYLPVEEGGMGEFEVEAKRAQEAKAPAPPAPAGS